MKLARALLRIITSKPKNGITGGVVNAIRNDPMWFVHEVETACASCRRQGISARCMHVARPPWQDVRNQSKRMRALLQGDENAMRREILNEDMEDLVVPAFSSLALDYMEQEEEMMAYSGRLPSPVSHVFIGIDPAAGGKQSRYAIVSLIIQPRSGTEVAMRMPSGTYNLLSIGESERAIVVGAENIDAQTPEDAVRGFVRHVRALAALREFSQSTFIVIPESNLANEGSHLQMHVRHYAAEALAMEAESIDPAVYLTGYSARRLNLASRIKFMADPSHPGKIGFRTTDETKAEIAGVLNSRITSKGLLFWKNMVCAGSGPKIDAITVRTQIMYQLRKYEREVDLDPKTGAVRKVYYSGKRNGPDDLVIALQIAASQCRVVLMGAAIGHDVA